MSLHCAQLLHPVALDISCTPTSQHAAARPELLTHIDMHRKTMNRQQGQGGGQQAPAPRGAAHRFGGQPPARQPRGARGAAEQVQRAPGVCRSMHTCIIKQLGCKCNHGMPSSNAADFAYTYINVQRGG